MWLFILPGKISPETLHQNSGPKFVLMYSKSSLKVSLRYNKSLLKELQITELLPSFTV